MNKVYLSQPVNLKVRRGAHLILKRHCKEAGLTQIDVMSGLIVEQLHPAITRGRRPTLWERIRRALFPRWA